MRKNIRILLITASVIITVLAMSACGTGYSLESSHEVDGRQGIAWENGRYYVSGSTSLSVYDAEWNRIKTETEPFGSFDAEVNHIGDVDVYKGEIYAGVEYFMDGVGSNIQMAVYDADSLQLKRTYMFEPDSGQMEVSGIAVDPDLDEFSVLPEKTLDDVTRQGEIEGISFDKDKKHMLISYNRGAIIVKGMPTGFYDGYDKEIHEIFVYWCPQ